METTSPPAAHLAESRNEAAPHQLQQPGFQAPMRPETQAAPQHEEPDLKLRGGNNGETCPGRFCFIIPCPLPCNFCVFPCPC